MKHEGSWKSSGRQSNKQKTCLESLEDFQWQKQKAVKPQSNVGLWGGVGVEGVVKSLLFYQVKILIILNVWC